MMKKVTKFLVVLVVLAVLLSFGACQKSNNAQSGTQAAAASPAAVRELKFWDMMWGPAETYPQAIGALVERFNRENGENIHVTLQNLPWDNSYQVFLTAVTSKNAPDASTGAFLQSVMYADMGEGLSLQPIIDAWRRDNSPVLRDYTDAMINLHRYNGEQYGLPWNLDTRQLLYRKDYFEQAGITQLPRNWNEFLDVCARLKRALPPDTFPMVHPGGGEGSGMHTLMMFMFQNDVGFTGLDEKPDFLNPKITEVLQFFNTMYTNGYVPEGISAYRVADAERVFQAGKAAMYHHSMMAMADFPELDANCAVMPPMAGPSSTTPKYWMWVNAIGAYSQTKDPQGTLAFVKWLAENEGSLWETGKMTSLPARASFLDQPYFNSNWQTRQANEFVVPTGVTPCYPVPSIYLPFTVLDGESYPVTAMARALSPNPNFREIQEDVQRYLIDAWADFGM